MVHSKTSFFFMAAVLLLWTPRLQCLSPPNCTVRGMEFSCILTAANSILLAALVMMMMI